MTWAVVAALAAGAAVLAWRGAPGDRLRPRSVRARGRPWTTGAGRDRWLVPVAASASGLLLVVGLGWWGLAAAIGLGVASAVAQERREADRAGRRRARLEAQLPQACDLLAVCLEAGLPLRRATEVIAGAVEAPLSEVLAELCAVVALGADEDRAWREAGLAEPTLATLAREVGRAVDSGVALSLSLRSLGVEARRAAASAAEVRARRVGVRSVLPLMLCFLPAFLLLGVVPIIGGVARHLLP